MQSRCVRESASGCFCVYSWRFKQPVNMCFPLKPGRKGDDLISVSSLCRPILTSWPTEWSTLPSCFSSKTPSGSLLLIMKESSTCWVEHTSFTLACHANVNSDCSLPRFRKEVFISWGIDYYPSVSGVFIKQRGRSLFGEVVQKLRHNNSWFRSLIIGSVSSSTGF